MRLNLPVKGSPERAHLESRFWEKVNRSAENDCWHWQSQIAWNGYGTFYFKDYKNTRAHRLALALYLDKSLESYEWVLHHCDNRPCCNPRHLYLGNRSDNMRDAVRRGRWASRAKGNTWTKGELNGRSKLTFDQIKVIRISIDEGYTNKQIGQTFGVSPSTISLIRCNKRWRQPPVS